MLGTNKFRKSCIGVNQDARAALVSMCQSTSTVGVTAISAHYLDVSESSRFLELVHLEYLGAFRAVLVLVSE
jgi:hypothetical protein